MAFIYKPYSKKYPVLFEKMKMGILSFSKEKLDIHHVGSSSVPGLGGKGIVDIQIGISKWSEAEEIVKILKKLGFEHFHPIENHSLFVSTKAACEEGDFHIHICHKGTNQYSRTLFFRDYLRNHPEEAKKYQELKIKLFAEANGDRQRYKKRKKEYFDHFFKTSIF